MFTIQYKKDINTNIAYRKLLEYTIAIEVQHFKYDKSHYKAHPFHSSQAVQ